MADEPGKRKVVFVNDNKEIEVSEVKYGNYLVIDGSVYRISQITTRFGDNSCDADIDLDFMSDMKVKP